MKNLLVILLVVVSFASTAKQWNKTFVVNYQLGDGDSKVSARELALEQIRAKASNDVGVYVQTTTTLVGNNLEESIKVIGASMIKLTSIKEAISTQNNIISMSVSANARVDETLLLSRIKALQNDEAKARQVAKLQTTNNELLIELKQVKKLLAKQGSSSSELSQILKRQTRLINRFDTNAKAIKNVFKRGSLFDMAKVSDNKYEQIKAELETSFFGPLLETKVSAEIIDVIPNNKTGQFTALISVSWIVPDSLNLTGLRKHLDMGYYERKNQRPVALSFNNYRNTGTDARTSFSERLFDYIGHQQVKVHISIGKHKIILPILWSDTNDSFNRYCSYGREFKVDDGEICINLKQNNTADIKGLKYNKNDNPIKLNLTNYEVHSITSVGINVVRSSL